MMFWAILAAAVISFFVGWESQRIEHLTSEQYRAVQAACDRQTHAVDGFNYQLREYQKLWAARDAEKKS